MNPPPTTPPSENQAGYPNLNKRTVLITGGATGIGASLVGHFVAQGARVGFIDIDAAAAKALVATLSADTTTLHKPLFVAADLTDIPALQAALSQHN